MLFSFILCAAHNTDIHFSYSNRILIIYTTLEGNLAIKTTLREKPDNKTTLC